MVRIADLPGILSVLFLVACGGCGPKFGALYYITGLHPKVTVEAKCTLTHGPLLILVDDDQELLNTPRAYTYLVDALIAELGIHDVNTKVIDPRRLSRLRQGDPKFEERGVREIGRQLGADQVLWLRVEEYEAKTRLEDFEHPPRFVVTTMVINALAERREDLRVWPDIPDGHRVSVTLPYQVAQKARSVDILVKQLALNLADEVARLFYEYEMTPEEAEKESRRVSL